MHISRVFIHPGCSYPGDTVCQSSSLIGSSHTFRAVYGLFEFAIRLFRSKQPLLGTMCACFASVMILPSRALLSSPGYAPAKTCCCSLSPSPTTPLTGQTISPPHSHQLAALQLILPARNAPSCFITFSDAPSCTVPSIMTPELFAHGFCSPNSFITVHSHPS